MPGRRYAFGNQAKVAQWNLWQLASALYPLINDAEVLEQILDDFSTYFWTKHDQMMASKFGFDQVTDGDSDFFTTAQTLLEGLKIDYTLFFTQLEKLTDDVDIMTLFNNVFYTRPTDNQTFQFIEFIQNYRNRLSKNLISKAQSHAIMQAVNPKFILRNYILFDCIAELNEGKHDLLNKVLTALENPYEELFPEFAKRRPPGYDGTPGCSTLSCSS